MEIYQLRAFVTVAKIGHLTRAAEALHVTQPAVTGQIKALEEELGIALFDRRPGRIALTRAGERLLPEAEKVLAAAGSLLGQARELQGEVSGSLVIGTVGDPDSLRLGSLLGGLVSALPGNLDAVDRFSGFHDGPNDLLDGISESRHAIPDGAAQVVFNRDPAYLGEPFVDLQIAAVRREACEPDRRGIVDELQRGLRKQHRAGARHGCWTGGLRQRPAHCFRRHCTHPRCYASLSGIDLHSICERKTPAARWQIAGSILDLNASLASEFTKPNRPNATKQTPKVPRKNILKNRDNQSPARQRKASPAPGIEHLAQTEWRSPSQILRSVKFT